MFKEPRFTAAATILVALFLLLPYASAQELDVQGDISYDLGYSQASDAFQKSELSYHLQLEREFGFDGKVHAAWKGNVAFRPQAGTTWRGPTGALNLDEAYFDVYLEATDLRFGRQVVSWGTADGINPTDVVNPRNRLSLSMDDLTGEPVPAAQAAYYLPSGASVTAVGILDFVPAAGAEDMLSAIGSGIAASTGQPVNVKDPQPVPADGSQFELALRGETLLYGHNVYATYFRGWDDDPAAWIEYTATPGGPVPTAIATQYRKVQKVGLATAGTLAGAGVWTETSYTIPEELAALDTPGALSINQPYFQSVIGGDYIFSSALNASLQVVYNGAGSLLTPYQVDETDPRTYLTGQIRYTPRPAHSFAGILLTDLTDRGALAVARYTYNLNQVSEITLGFTRVMGNSASQLAQYRGRIEGITGGISVSF